MTTIQGSKGRKYEVRSRRDSRENNVTSLWIGGIFLASTDFAGPNDEKESTIEQTIEWANQRADNLGIEVTE